MTKRARCKSAAFLAMLMIAFGCAAADRPVIVPMKLLGNFPNVTIDGNDVPLVVDLGNSGSVALTQAVIDRVQAMPTGETSRGIDPKGNVIEYPKFRIPRLQIATAVFTDVIGELDVHDPSYQATQVGQQGFFIGGSRVFTHTWSPPVCQALNRIMGRR
jgi:hypothetical protein